MAELSTAIAKKAVPATFTRRSLIGSGLAMGLVGCAAPAPLNVPSISSSRAYGFADLKPLDLAAENLIKITVCTRPFRPAGPRLEAEVRGSTFLVHNYGHGGSGWSLAWGYAEAVRDFVFAQGAKSVTVVGAGAMGLTTGISIAETGARVTILARDMPMEARSARATGVWSPSSRIGFAGATQPDIAARREKVARRSYARHLTYLGRGGNPVEFTPRFYVRSDTPEPPIVPRPNEADRFVELGRALRGLTPPWTEREDTPFPGERGVRGGLVMTFNIAAYTRQLVEDFQAMGGRIERETVASGEEMARLSGDAIVNCAGYDARTLASDDTLIPVRGQIAWMAPQLDRLYGVHHRGITVLSRRDGLLIQESGGNDFYGLGDASESPDRGEFEAALGKVAPLFDWE